MRKFTMRLSETLYDALVRHASDTKASTSDIGRRALERYLSTALAPDPTVPVMPQEPPPDTPRPLPQTVHDAPLPKAILHTSHINGVGYHVRCPCGSIFLDDGGSACQACRRR
jgi:hypothetical protein